MTPLDAFVARQNVKRLREILAGPLNDTTRAEIQRQLQEACAALSAEKLSEVPPGE